MKDSIQPRAKKVPTRAFTCNLPIPFFEQLEKLSRKKNKPIRDVLMEAALKGLTGD